MQVPRLQRILFFFFLLLVVFVVGGLGGVFLDRTILPRLLSHPAFERFEFFKRAVENVTIINRTEEVVIREDDAIERIVAQPATAVVNIIFPSSLGLQRTGVLLTNDGLIATFAPDLTDPSTPTVLLYDGTSQEATLVGKDTLSGLVFYRMAGRNTPAIALANSDDSRVGRRLIAIGNSEAEYQNRLAVGVLGHKNRTFNLSGKTVASSEKWEGVFEMDMPQAREFVGGAVIGYNGEMVGMVGKVTLDNTEKYFLLPANAVREAFDRLLAGTLESRPELGVYYLPLTKALAISRELSRDRGALVYSPSGRTGLSVLAGTPADSAGIRYGDIIIAINGVEVNLDRPLSVLIGQLKKGDIATLLVLRAGEEISIPIAL